MSVLDRLETIRENEKLKKKEFEEIIGKSSGYIKVLRDRNGIPGSDVLIKISEYFRKYNMDWVLSGQGAMLKEEKETAPHVDLKEPGHNYDNASLQRVKEEIREDLNQLAKGMAKNFEVMAKGMQTSIQRQEIIIDFVEKLDADRISKATGNLEEFLKSK